VRNRIASLLFNQVGVLLGLIVVAFVAYVIIGQPAWAIDPLRNATSDVLGGMGAGLILLLVWAGWMGWVFSRGFRYLVRKWRYVLGLSFLLAGAFAALSYFHWSFPLIGEAPLGGDLGGQLRGSYGSLGLFRTIVLITLGAWLIAPVLFNHAAVWMGRGVLATSRGIGSGVNRIRHRDQGAVMQEIDDYLASNAAASRAAQMDTLRAADEYRRNTTPPRGLAYMEPTSPKPVTPRPAEPEGRPEQKSDFWPGLKGADPGVSERQPSTVATATMAPPSVENATDMGAATAHETESRHAAEEAHATDDLYVKGTLQADVEETLTLAVPIETPWGEITVAAEPSAPELEAPRAVPAVAPSPLPNR